MERGTSSKTRGSDSRDNVDSDELILFPCELLLLTELLHGRLLLQVVRRADTVGHLSSGKKKAEYEAAECKSGKSSEQEPER